MKTIHFPIVLSVLIAYSMIAVFSLVPSVYAETGDFMVHLNGTQYDIHYKTTNVSVEGVSTHLNSYYDNRLDFDITSSATQDGSMSVSMPNEAVATIFCVPSRAVGDIGKGFDFSISTDKKAGEKFDQTTYINNTSFAFDVPAGSKKVTFYHMFVGMAVADPVQYAGIPGFKVYHQGEQVSLNGIVQDGCNRRLPNSDIMIKPGIPYVGSQKIQADKAGLFYSNFTIPNDTASGRYRMELDGKWENMSGRFYSTLLIEEKNQTNVPYRLEDPRLGTFVISYKLDGGEISNVGVDPISNIMFIDYYASHAGTLYMRIPQDLMAFVGTENDTTMMYSGLRNRVPITEHLDSQGNRVFDLPVTAGHDNVINIQGITYGKNGGYDRQGVIPVKINDTLYPLPYNITHGSFGVTADAAKNALVLRIETSMNGGHLHLVLPRKVIDSTMGGVDKNFVVMDLERNNAMIPQLYNESQTTNNTRTLEMDFGKGETVAYIYGTYMVPEFPFAVPILLAGTISSIVFYRMKFGK